MVLDDFGYGIWILCTIMFIIGATVECFIYKDYFASVAGVICAFMSVAVFYISKRFIEIEKSLLIIANILENVLGIDADEEEE